MDILFAILSAVLFGTMAVAIRVGLRRADPESGAIVMTAIAFLIAVVTALLFADFGATQGLWRFVVAGAIAPGASQILYVSAIRDAGASRTGIIVGTAPVLAALLAIALLDERLPLGLALATALIVIGTMVLAWEPGRPVAFRPIGLVYAGLCSILFGLVAIAMRWAASGSDVSPALAGAVTLGTGLVVTSILAALLGRRVQVAQLPALARAFLPAGFMCGSSYMLLLEAYERGRVTVVAPLSATESLWAVLGATVVLGRAADAIGWRVVVAAVLIVAGGVLVGWMR
ncbi:MAG: DMT family transporter [Candidatus Binatia bacterium]